ncbi:TetR/AcrR family transcriptional regulator [Brachybacterium sp.]|uniref:TetR/AcrR family transcriptional regulator n=1 Tax=Brachybacterium sp. TaxID=1891286 RepID=UPI002ED6255E
MAESNETGLPRAVMIAWGMEEAPQRGPSRGLSHERIVAAAIELADAEGLAAVTMQAVAKALGFTTMSLYRYVSSKDELLLLMQDAAFALPEKSALPAGWRAALPAWAELVRAAYRSHPWALEISRGQSSVMMPNSVRAADLGMAALADLEVDQESKIGVILVVSQLAASMVELEGSLAEEGVVSTTPEGAGLLAEVITPERFPHIATLFTANARAGVEGTPSAAPVIDGGTLEVDGEFGLGLSLLIDGLEARQRAGAEPLAQQPR